MAGPNDFTPDWALPQGDPNAVVPGQAPAFGLPPLAPPVAPWDVAPATPQPSEPVAPSPFHFEDAPPEAVAPPPPWQPASTSVKVKYKGYDQPEPRIPHSAVTAPLYAQRREVDAAGAAAETQAQGAEQMGRLQDAYDTNVTLPDLQQKSDILGSYEQVRQNLAHQFEGERSEREGRIQQAIDAIPQTDTGRWWTDRTSMQHSMGYLSAAIEGYLKPGGQNGAINLAMKLADQDAQAQAQDIATARAKVGYEQSGYERLLGEQQLRTQDYLAAKEMRLQSLAVATEIKGMSFKSPITQQKYKMQADEVRAAAANTRVERLQGLAIAETGALNSAAERNHAEHMQQLAIESAEKIAGAKADAKAAADQNVLRDPTTGQVIVGRDGKPSQVVGTDAQVADFNTKVAGSFSLQDKLRRFEALQAKAGRIVGGQRIWNNEDEALATGLYNQILADYVRSISGAQASDKEVERLQQVYPLKKLLSADNAGVIKQFREGARTALQHEINTRTTGGWDGLTEALDKRTGPLPEPVGPGQELAGTGGQLTTTADPALDIQRMNLSDPATGPDTVRAALQKAQTLVEETQSGHRDPDLARASVAMLNKKVVELRQGGHAAEADALNKSVMDLLIATEKAQSRRDKPLATSPGYGGWTAAGKYVAP